MALNKYMHPRNIYRIPPDFYKLAKQYTEFSNIAKQDVGGKVSIDFKDPNSLRVLTKCLLHSDFDLKVEIPEDRLVPTLPLRLNYILWLEDLMTALQRTDINGIDIGTGACAVYPLLGAVKNKWHMIGTETDQLSADMAQKNVKENNLEKFVKIVKTSSSTLIQHIFSEEDTCYDFCMCNPPFYSSVQELLESRSPARPPPKNGFTGSPQELITDGGELEFVRKLIAESKNLKDNLLIFTSMVGHKYNLKILSEDLKSENIRHTYTEFCQGRITRWGLAWTFKDYNIQNMVPPPKDKHGKKVNIHITHILPPLINVPFDLENMSKKFIEILKDLKISYKIIIKRGHCIVMDIVAKSNTWSNQRRKKRLMKRLEESEVKKSKLNINNKEEKGIKDMNINSADIVNSNHIHLKNEPSNCCEVTNCNEQQKQSLPTNSEISFENSSVEPLIHAVSKLIKKENNFVLEINFVNGTGGKEGVHQIIQYIKNNWK